MPCFTSADFGAFVFGREILKKNPDASLQFYVGGVTPTAKEKCFSESDFYQPALEHIVSGQTRFGRVGIFYDRKNMPAKTWAETVPEMTLDYAPSDDRRAEKTPRITFFEIQLLREMASEGLADSVEFRRLARKFIRNAKHANIDSIFFCDAMLGEEKTKKILQHLAGTQIKLYFPSDFLAENIIGKSEKSKKRDIEIHTGDDAEFTHVRAEAVMRTKIGGGKSKR